MEKVGIVFGFFIFDVKSKDVKVNFCKMIENGLSKDVVLVVLMIIFVKMFGVFDMLGMVVMGKIVNLVVID